MSISTSRGSYTDCYDLFDRALQTDFGVQRIFLNYGDAVNFRLRMNKARQLDRILNSRMEANGDPNHPKFNRSNYDPFTIRIRFDEKRKRWLCRIERNKISDQELEDIVPDFAAEIEAETGLDLTPIDGEFEDEAIEGAS